MLIENLCKVFWEFILFYFSDLCIEFGDKIDKRKKHGISCIYCIAKISKFACSIDCTEKMKRDHGQSNAIYTN